MPDIIIRRRGGMAYIIGETVEGCGWIKANMYMREEYIVVIQLEHLEHWISEMNEAELTYEFN